MAYVKICLAKKCNLNSLSADWDLHSMNSNCVLNVQAISEVVLKNRIILCKRYQNTIDTRIQRYYPC